MKYDVIVIGAGAAGLLALKELSESGLACCLLEAADRIGGRMHSITGSGFDRTVEAGAEFIHGNLPLTLQLLKEGKIAYEAVEGKMISVQHGKWLQDEPHDEHWSQFMKKLSQLNEDCTVTQFLERHFAGSSYADLRDSVQRFAEGFDLADITKASMLSLQQEWKHENAEQYRVVGGYIKLAEYLLHSSKTKNADVHLSACASRIVYTPNAITVYTTDQRRFEATKLIMTVSIAVLRSGVIEFVPGLPELQHIIGQFGFGSVIKILLQFKSGFWKQKTEKDIGFLLTNEDIPTWWTQLPAETNILTGWLGGPKAEFESIQPAESLLNLSLISLASIFNVEMSFLRDQLTHHRIICWDNEAFVHGGYSYNTVLSGKARTLLAEPIEHTIFFAGEALFDGEPQGTVEAALQSGKKAAGMVMLSF